MKKLHLVLFILIILSLGLVIRSELTETTDETSPLLNDDTVSSADSLLAQDPLVTYTSIENGLGNRIRLQHPPTAEINQFNNEILLEYSGFNNSLNAQVTDGYRVVIIKHGDQTAESFFEEVDSVIAAQPVVVNEIDGYTYLTPSELGDGALEHVIFAPNDNFLIEVQYVVAGEAKATYRDLVWAVIQSIEVVE